MIPSNSAILRNAAALARFAVASSAAYRMMRNRVPMCGSVNSNRAGASAATAGRAAPAVEHAAYRETIPGSNISFDMVPIPAGTFMMGSPRGEADRDNDEGPQVKVQLAAFWMEKCETTWDMYDLYWKDENLQ